MCQRAKNEHDSEWTFKRAELEIRATKKEARVKREKNKRKIITILGVLNLFFFLQSHRGVVHEAEQIQFLERYTEI